MNDVSDQLRKLVEGLYRATMSSSIMWVSKEENIFEAPLGKGYVQVLSEVDEEGDFYHIARIVNDKKEVVDTIYGGTLSGGNWTSRPTTGHTDYWKLLTDLFVAARRSAVGAQEIISSMLDELPSAPTTDHLSDDTPF